MANDGSLASLTEQWIVDQIRALPAFEDRFVEVFPGFIGKTGQEAIAQLTTKGSPYIAVAFRGDVAIPLEEGEQRFEPTYDVFALVQNERSGAGRTGDGDAIGTNGIRDLLRTALQNKEPNLTAGGFHVDLTEFRGSQIVFDRADLFIQRSTIVTKESPAAAP